MVMHKNAEQLEAHTNLKTMKTNARHSSNC